MPKQHLTTGKEFKMGGNVAVVDIKGNTIPAEKMDLSKFPRDYVVKEMLKAFLKLNDIFKKEYGYPLWKNKGVLTSGFAFNGSTSAMFDPNVDGKEFTKHKPFVGDIDITVPKTEKENLWKLVKKLQGKKITPNTKYIGDNRPKFTGAFTQINGIIELTNGKFIVQAQVDFEFTAFTDDVNHQPDIFAKFGHSSDWSDISVGLKGVAHKFIMRSLTHAISVKTDAMIIAQKTYEKIDPKTGEMTRKILKRKLKAKPNFLKFSVDHGLRYAYEKVIGANGKHETFKGKKLYFEIDSAGATYEQTLETMFFQIFGKEGTDKDIKLMWSYVGILALIKKYFNSKQMEVVFDSMVKQWWKGQELERGNPQLDNEIKQSSIDAFYKVFPKMKTKQKSIDALKKVYYAKYDKRNKK
jgi:hypothetical protein